MSKTLDQLVGQLIIAGFRSDKVSDSSNISRYIKKYNLSGVILYDEDLEKSEPGTRNIKSPAQVKTCFDHCLRDRVGKFFGNKSIINRSNMFPRWKLWKPVGCF